MGLIPLTFLVSHLRFLLPTFLPVSIVPAEPVGLLSCPCCNFTACPSAMCSLHSQLWDRKANKLRNRALMNLRARPVLGRQAAEPTWGTKDGLKVQHVNVNETINMRNGRAKRQLSLGTCKCRVRVAHRNGSGCCGELGVAKACNRFGCAHMATHHCSCGHAPRARPHILYTGWE